MRKTKKNYKGGQLNIRYPGFCDNNPSQCLEMLNQCNGGKMIKKSIKRNKKVERKHEKRGSGYSTILKGSDQTLCNDQTSSEKAQFGCLYNNDWAAGLGENAGVTAQMQANAAGPGQAGGRRMFKRGEETQCMSEVSEHVHFPCDFLYHLNASPPALAGRRLGAFT